MSQSGAARTVAEEWVKELAVLARRFEMTRGRPIVLKVHLPTESFNVAWIVPGPGSQFLTLDVYPDVEPGPAMEAALVKGKDGMLYTPRIVVVNLNTITKVELLHGSGEEREVAFGFRAPEETAPEEPSP